MIDAVLKDARKFRRPRKRLVSLAAGACRAAIGATVGAPGQSQAAQLHFDTPLSYNSAKFPILNYASISGNDMNMKTDAQRSLITGNNNVLSAYYNNFSADYATQPSATAEADAINAYVQTNFTKTGTVPAWLSLNEVGASYNTEATGTGDNWYNTGTAGSTYRAWVIGVATRLHTVYGYNLLTYVPGRTAVQAVNLHDNIFSADWQSLAAQSDLGIESFINGPTVMAGGSDYASRVTAATASYNTFRNAYSVSAGIDPSKLMYVEYFSNSSDPNVAYYGRAGLDEADWDTALQIRQDAIRATNPVGFDSYDWVDAQMTVTTAEWQEQEYYYRTRITMPGQQPQWLPDAAYTIGDAATPVPLSWNQPLNWLGSGIVNGLPNSIPNSVGAVANFFDTNTTKRTITLDGNQTVGVLSINSPHSYVIESGTGGTLFLQNSGAPVSVTVPQGSHVLLAPVSLTGDATFSVDGTLAINGGFTAATTGTITRTGAGTLSLASTLTFPSGATFAASSGTTNFMSNARNLAVTVSNATVNFNANQNIAALTVNSGGAVNASSSSIVVNAASVSVSGGKIDLADNALVARSGTLGGATANVYSGLTGSIQSGRNGGAWNGNGIITSMSAARLPDPITTLGIAKASDALDLTGSQTKSWRGQTVDANAILIAYTYAGDANLDGRVDEVDYFQIDCNYGKTSSTLGWFNGDFNYDGQINGDDYFLIDNAFADQGAPFNSVQMVSGLSSVPEPSSLASIVLAGFLVSRRQLRDDRRTR